MERFWGKVDKSGDCWTWAAGKTADGYGNFKLNGKDRYAHRLSYEWAHGPIAEGLTVDHLCRNRACVNPEHLEAVAARTNVLRGHGVTATKARQDSCVRGHAFDQKNTYQWRGSRICRTCRAEYNRARYSALAGKR